MPSCAVDKNREWLLRAYKPGTLVNMLKLLKRLKCGGGGDS